MKQQRRGKRAGTLVLVSSEDFALLWVRNRDLSSSVLCFTETWLCGSITYSFPESSWRAANSSERITTRDQRWRNRFLHPQWLVNRRDCSNVLLLWHLQSPANLCIHPESLLHSFWSVFTSHRRPMCLKSNRGCAADEIQPAICL